MEISVSSILTATILYIQRWRLIHCMRALKIRKNQESLIMLGKIPNGKISMYQAQNRRKVNNVPPDLSK